VSSSPKGQPLEGGSSPSGVMPGAAVAPGQGKRNSGLLLSPPRTERDGQRLVDGVNAYRMLPAKERQKKLGLIVALLSYMAPGLRELISPAAFFLCKAYLSVGQRPPKRAPVR
jgi:hypothetical protein